MERDRTRGSRRRSPRAGLFCAAALAALLAGAAPGAHADTITLGTFTFPGNGFPFGGSGSGASTRYQQVYAAANFSGPMLIDQISFFQDGTGEVRGATYTLFLSTTSVAVNGLDIVDLDSNVGADDALFVATALSGAAPAVLTFAGAPFVYDPSAGNLLLDIQVSGAGANPADRALFQEDRATGGSMSKAHDFGAGFTNRGLVTRFDFLAIPEPASGSLLAAGLAALALATRRGRAAG